MATNKIIGSGANQVPNNSQLGRLAYLDRDPEFDKLGTLAHMNAANTPAINLISDSGKFTPRANPLSSDATTYDLSIFKTWFVWGNNNASDVEVGKFIKDNSTNGGSGAALTQTVQDWLSKSGRTGNNARYGVEFFITELTMASTPTAPVIDTDYYRVNQLSAGVNSLFSSNGWGTMALWLRAVSDPVKIRIIPGDIDDIAIYKDGVLIADMESQNPVIDPSENWVHLRIACRVTRGSYSVFPNLYARPNATFQVCLPAAFCGLVDTGIHVSPILNINELIP